MSKSINRDDMNPAAKLLRDQAPTLSHADRRACLKIADWLERGFDFDMSDEHAGIIVLNMPIYVDNELVGYTELWVEVLDDGDINVTSNFRPEEWRKDPETGNAYHYDNKVGGWINISDVHGGHRTAIEEDVWDQWQLLPSPTTSEQLGGQ